MQTTRYPLWKTALWVLGILAYGLGATALSAFAAWSLHFPIAFPGGYEYACVSGGLWVGLLAVGAWRVSTLGHKTAGRMLAVMATIVVLSYLSLASWLSTGKWWLGWLGLPNPSAVINQCDGPVSGPGWDVCASHAATETAEAPHPPDWLPWGNPVTLNLIDFGIHPELYQGRTVTTEGEILGIHSPTEFYLGPGSYSNGYQGAYVVAPDQSYTKDIRAGDMVWLKGIAGGDCKNHYSGRYSTNIFGIICAEEIRDLGR